MKELKRKNKKLSIVVYESASTPNVYIVKVILNRKITIAIFSKIGASLSINLFKNILLSYKSLKDLREVLRLNIGDNIDNFSDEDLNEFAQAMLKATAVALKANYLLKTKII